MKKAAILVLSLVFLISCNTNKKSEREGETVIDPEDSVEREFTMDDIDEDQDNVETGDETVKPYQTTADFEFAGTYQKIEEEGPGTDCNRLEVSFTTPSQLCIAEEKIYISAKFEKTGDDTAAIFLVGPTDIQKAENELPWEEFDTTTPIATLALQPNGTMVLDWKGFHIDGEIATDYAIFGKKTLEGTYKKL